MTENVIEKLAGEWGSIPTDGETVGRMGAAINGYHEAAKELQAATRPEQFMPPLIEWPEWANWCAIDADGDIGFAKNEPESKLTEWFLDEYAHWIDIPIGIDWRTLKVSRAQMEAYEDEKT